MRDVVIQVGGQTIVGTNDNVTGDFDVMDNGLCDDNCTGWCGCDAIVSQGMWTQDGDPRPADDEVFTPDPIDYDFYLD